MTRAALAAALALVLLGADCPHCEADAPAAEAAAQVTPPCHGSASGEPVPEPDAAPRLDCGCASCESGDVALPLTASAQPVRTAVAVTLSPPPAPVVATRHRPAWTPPPYPGFFEQTVVRLN